jgi:hypothetical protein
VEANKDDWVNRIGRYAPWGGRIESEGLAYKPTQFTNQSARSWVGTGDDVQIAGFVIQGTENKKVFLRAAGPSLVPLGVSNALADPVIELRDQRSGMVVGSNDNWSENPSDVLEIEQVASRFGAFSWPRGSKDSALLMSLAPGVYTAVVRGRNNSTGVGLVELYRADEPTGTRLMNVSTRSYTKSGDEVQIAGFVIGGVQPKTILIRAAGPALIPLGVAGALADPQLELHNQRTGQVIQGNDNWDRPGGSDDAAVRDRIEAAVKTVGALPWSRGSKDAALLIMLEPGIYTTVVKGVNDSVGVSLIEVFDVR